MRLFLIAKDLERADSLLNESLGLTRVCIDTCLLYKLYVGALRALKGLNFFLKPLNFYSDPASAR